MVIPANKEDVGNGQQERIDFGFFPRDLQKTAERGVPFGTPEIAFSALLRTSVMLAHTNTARNQ